MEHDVTINGNSGDTAAMRNPITGGVDLPGKGAARKFVNTKELAIMMGDHVPDEDLPMLCLVNSYFNSMFSPRLYRHIRLNAKFLKPKTLAWVAGNQRFRHTKILSFDKACRFDASKIDGYDAGDGPSEGPTLPEWLATHVQRTATDVVRNSPTLHTIITPIGSDKAVLILNNGFNGNSKRSSTNLQSLTLNLDANPCRELSASIFRGHNLKSLCLTRIPTASWRVGSLCQILVDSPELRYLKLSYLNGAEHQWELEEICKQYKQLGGTPLKLEVVIFGWGVNLKLPTTAVDVFAQASYLSLLTDPTVIQEMGIIAGRQTAWDTFDLSFFPNMNRFSLSASTHSVPMVRDFFALRKGRDFLSRVHFRVGGPLFTKYHEFRDMTRKLFIPYYLNEPTSTLNPMGFSFHSKLPLELVYQRSIALPLPATRFLDITIHYKHLVGISGAGLSKMSALECLSLNVYVYRISEWDDSRTVDENLLEALGKAAKNCPNLRYVRIKMGATGPVRAPIAGLSCSGEIVRERRPRCRNLHPVFKLLDAATDKLLRPQCMWTEAEKRAQYVDEPLDELVLYKPLWMG
ncbi:hypothetical protein SLS64_001429 [Diaporthe eres]|uniref:F-box domain-containing protein n=1 Tax=Diaporthe eres TaxID=83184 RepID=A0ABR1NRP7_DIAER